MPNTATYQWNCFTYGCGDDCVGGYTGNAAKARCNGTYTLTSPCSEGGSADLTSLEDIPLDAPGGGSPCCASFIVPCNGGTGPTPTPSSPSPTSTPTPEPTPTPTPDPCENSSDTEFVNIPIPPPSVRCAGCKDNNHYAGLPLHHLNPLNARELANGLIKTLSSSIKKGKSIDTIRGQIKTILALRGGSISVIENWMNSPTESIQACYKVINQTNIAIEQLSKMPVTAERLEQIEKLQGTRTALQEAIIFYQDLLDGLKPSNVTNIGDLPGGPTVLFSDMLLYLALMLDDRYKPSDNCSEKQEKAITDELNDRYPNGMFITVPTSFWCGQSDSDKENYIIDWINRNVNNNISPNCFATHQGGTGDGVNPTDGLMPEGPYVPSTDGPILTNPTPPGLLPAHIHSPIHR